MNVTKVDIITPSGEAARGMYRDLWEIFPYDRPVYNEILNNGKTLYSMKSYSIFKDEQFVGNAGLFPVKMWYGGEMIDFIGVGAVATMPEFRKQGVARHLIQHCIDIVDKSNTVSMLFTELPVVYEKNGSETISQDYMAVKAANIDFDKNDFDFKYYETIDVEQVDLLREFYNNSYPNYDGKIVRTDDPDYWDYYVMMFNPYMKPRIVIIKDDNGQCRGYCRFDVDKDRLTITELCTGEDDADSCGALLCFVAEFARLTGFEILTLAICVDHLVWDLIRRSGIEIAVEPEGVRREVLMIRPAKGENLDHYNDLLWSLADKF